MTKKEILSKLITHYEYVIKYFPKKDWLLYLAETYTDNGICHCADKKFREYIYKKAWVLKHKKPCSTYWSACPSDAGTRTEAIKLLQFRVDLMKQILNIKLKT